MRRAGALLAVILLLGCQGTPPPSTPDAAWARFALALRSSDARTAWESLTPRTRDLLSERSRAIAAAAPGLIKDDPQSMLLQSGVKPLEVGEVRVTGADEHRATLEVVVGGKVQHITMVRDAGPWQVELTDVLVEVTRRD